MPIKRNAGREKKEIEGRTIRLYARRSHDGRMSFPLNYTISTKLFKVVQINEFFVLRRAVYCKKLITEVRSFA